MGANESTERGEGGNLLEYEYGDGGEIYRDLLEPYSDRPTTEDGDMKEEAMGLGRGGGGVGVRGLEMARKDVNKAAVVANDCIGTGGKDGKEELIKAIERELTGKEIEGPEEDLIQSTPTSRIAGTEEVAAGVRIPEPPKSAEPWNSKDVCRTMDGRPIYEPPIFNYERFVREAVPSDEKLKSMFEDDVETRTAFRDGQTEVQLVGMFHEWVFDSLFDKLRVEGLIEKRRPGDPAGVVAVNNGSYYGFYRDLFAELTIDLHSVEDEHKRLLKTLSPLARWEYQFLDNDGEHASTTSIQSRLSRGEDPFTMYQGGDAARKKYDYLLKELPHRPSHDLETWNYYPGNYMRWILEEDKQPNRTRRWPDTPIPKDEYHIVVNNMFTKYYYGGEQAMEEQQRFYKRMGGTGGPSTKDPHAHRRMLNEFLSNIEPRNPEDDSDSSVYYSPIAPISPISD